MLGRSFERTLEHFLTPRWGALGAVSKQPTGLFTT